MKRLKNDYRTTPLRPSNDLKIQVILMIVHIACCFCSIGEYSCFLIFHTFFHFYFYLINDIHFVNRFQNRPPIWFKLNMWLCYDSYVIRQEAETIQLRHCVGQRWYAIKLLCYKKVSNLSVLMIVCMQLNLPLKIKCSTQLPQETYCSCSAACLILLNSSILGIAAKAWMGIK